MGSRPRGEGHTGRKSALVRLLRSREHGAVPWDRADRARSFRVRARARHDPEYHTSQAEINPWPRRGAAPPSPCRPTAGRGQGSGAGLCGQAPLLGELRFDRGGEPRHLLLSGEFLDRGHHRISGFPPGPSPARLACPRRQVHRLPEPHPDPAERGDAAPRGQDTVRAHEGRRDHRGAGGQRQPRQPGLPLVEAAVRRAGPLRENSETLCLRRARRDCGPLPPGRSARGGGRRTRARRHAGHG